ncbi:DUF3987 domain-containing protein [Mangrovimonas xylaniphaga]|uniref:DUF3987 domain-containing protein n=1 Tax=Mangrovimonas xylaniphaga TaxID=1645915 RepID=UPI0006B63715|nr:DUF3987 domain-containing protein [Mangrovimonas xylaniphaga]
MEYSSIDEIENELDGFSKSNIEIAREKLFSIIDQLPSEYSDLIEHSFIYKRIPKEYLLSSILFTVSTSIGLTFSMNVLGYVNYPNLYFTIIGSRGDAKSEAIKLATNPLKQVDDLFYSDFKESLRGVNSEEEVEMPIRKQVLIQNASIEAAHKIHAENPNSIGILIDEIFGLIDKMGNSNSRDGVAWRNFLLEGYTNGHVDVSRKTTESFRINKTCPTLMGGLQHQFVPNLFANGNLESGFIDRLLFTPKLTANKVLKNNGIPIETILNYDKSIKNILEYKLESERLLEERKQFEITMSGPAKAMVFEYCQELINRQSKTRPVLKEYMSKMQISIHKFCILVFMMKYSQQKGFGTNLCLDEVRLAIELNEYYYTNFNIILESCLSVKESKNEPEVEHIIAMAKRNNASQKAVVEVTGLTKGTISKRWNKN